MNKEEYLSSIEKANNEIKQINELKQINRKKYIQTNAPCKKGDIVEIKKLKIGSSIVGIAESFGILQDDNVYVTAIKTKVGSKNIYFTKPYSSIKVVDIDV
jgi:hypothetical protein